MSDGVTNSKPITGRSVKIPAYFEKTPLTEQQSNAACVARKERE